MPAWCLPKPRYFSKTEKKPDQLQLSSHFTSLNLLFIYLFISLFPYAQCSLEPTNFPERRLPKPTDLPKSENRFFHLQLFLTHFTTHNPLLIYLPVYIHTRRLLKPSYLPEWGLPKHRDLSEIPKIRLFSNYETRNYCSCWGLYCRRTYLFSSNVGYYHHSHVGKLQSEKFTQSLKLIRALKHL